MSRVCNILTLLAILFSVSANAAVDCEQHPIFCHIKRLQPGLDSKFAMEMSNRILKVSSDHKIDAKIVTAIINQESGFQQINRTEMMAVKINDNYELVEGMTDFGVYQIHVMTAKFLGFDLKLLEEDLGYATKCFSKILGRKLDQCRHMDYPWSCYHSKTEHHRKEYIKRILKWAEK